MPARSLKAAPDKELQGEIKELKKKVSDLENANIRQGKELGAAQKDQKKLADAKESIKQLQAQLEARDAEIGRLEADLNSARATGGRDAEILAAAKQVAKGLKKLGA